MRVLYGVAGEGLGHATRSRVVVEHLLSAGHDVYVATSGRAYDALRRVLPRVASIDALRLTIRDGVLDIAGSVVDNLARMPAMLARDALAMRAVDTFAPHVVITDFEPFACFYAKVRGMRVLSVDNIQMIARCIHADIVLGKHAGVASANAWARIPLCDHYIVTTFFYPKVRPELEAKTTLVPPIVRREIVSAATTVRDHVLVYHTAAGDSRMMDALHSNRSQRFIVYGLGRSGIDRNCVLREFSETGFVRDLASARGVITSGGMSLLGECVYLGKPVHCVPIRGHFEQEMNAHYLESTGYGTRADAFSADSIRGFLEAIPTIARGMRPSRDGNARALRAVDTRLVQLASAGQ